MRPTVPLTGGPRWYKDAIIYEVPVRAFRDSNGDGVGDFRGLVEKLDYLHDLGVTALWLLPFYPSPGRDDGYDIADYNAVNPRYGSLADFKLFLREAHRRGLRVITELVVNHTSDQHPWFQRARRAAPGDPYRDFYIWSDTDTRFREARIIFKDFETSNWAWDPVAGAYYWHRFYSHQPDLNYDNPKVQAAVFDALDFWLEMGIDGLRLDAVPYLYEREGTNCENLPETHAFLQKLRAHVDSKYSDRMLLAEANQWPEDAVAYFGNGDECHMAFHFPVMPRLFMAIRMEDRLPVVDILQQTPAIPPSCQWALFLRNHDELTLEMVTDEDRDYMYRVYARDPQARLNLGIRRRLAPLLDNHRARIELMNGLLFSLPGTPVLYYGDEIGMGDNIYLGDRNGVRTPMQWNAERNAGFSRANPQSLYLPLIIDPEYHYQAVNVEVQQNNPNSLLWWTKRLIDLRKRHPAFGRGGISFLTPDNHKVLAFVRGGPTVRTSTAPSEDAIDDAILVVANLSRLTQYVELDLGAYQGWTPVELLGRTRFPTIGPHPYLLTLAPYAFYWFGLERRRVETPAVMDSTTDRPTFAVAGRWEQIFQGKPKELLQEWLINYMPSCPWFTPRPAQLEAAMIMETVPVPVASAGGSSTVQVALVQVEFSEGDPEAYVLPLAFAQGAEAERIQRERPQAVLARLGVESDSKEPQAPQSGILYDPLSDAPFCWALLDAILRPRRFRRAGGELVGVPLQGRPSSNGAVRHAPPSRFRGDQRNTSVLIGNEYVLKIFRKVEEGINPEAEVGRFLTQHTAFHHVPRLLGTLEYRRGWGEPITLGVLYEYAEHQTDGWHFCQDALGRYFEQALARPERRGELPLPRRSLVQLRSAEVPRLAQDMIGTPLETARLLGQRTAELHLALASHPEDPAFVAEPFTTLYQRSLYQSLRSQARQAFVLLRRQMNGLPEDLREEARRLQGEEETLLQRVRSIYTHKVHAQRIRCHCDLTLREVLYTGRDVLFIDFEGVTFRPLSDRRRKYTPLRDLACMLRSFHAAALVALTGGRIRQEDVQRLEPWADLWQLWMSVSFLKGYWDHAEGDLLLPAGVQEQDLLLHFYLMKRALNELRYGLSRGPTQARIAIRGLLHVLDMPPVSGPATEREQPAEHV